jgi:hypothetical protein
MFNFLLSILILLLFYDNGKAQDLQVISQDGTFTNYSISKPLKITYDSSSLFLSENNTLLKKWNFGELRKIVYVNVAGSIEENMKDSELYVLHAFPQPIQDKLNVSYEVPNSGLVSLEIYSLTGNLVYSSKLGVQTKGYYSTIVYVPFMPTGQYMLCIKGNSFSRNIPVYHL